MKVGSEGRDSSEKRKRRRREKEETKNPLHNSHRNETYDKMAVTKLDRKPFCSSDEEKNGFGREASCVRPCTMW